VLMYRPRLAVRSFHPKSLDSSEEFVGKLRLGQFPK
jgi:hypothetical protein